MQQLKLSQSTAISTVYVMKWDASLQYFLITLFLIAHMTFFLWSSSIVYFSNRHTCRLDDGVNSWCSHYGVRRDRRERTISKIQFILFSKKNNEIKVKIMTHFLKLNIFWSLYTLIPPNRMYICSPLIWVLLQNCMRHHVVFKFRYGNDVKPDMGKRILNIDEITKTAWHGCF